MYGILSISIFCIFILQHLDRVDQHWARNSSPPTSHVQHWNFYQEVFLTWAYHGSSFGVVQQKGSCSTLMKTVDFCSYCWYFGPLFSLIFITCFPCQSLVRVNEILSSLWTGLIGCSILIKTCLSPVQFCLVSQMMTVLGVMFEWLLHLCMSHLYLNLPCYFTTDFRCLKRDWCQKQLLLFYINAVILVQFSAVLEIEERLT